MVNLFQRQKHDNRGVEGEDHEQQPANERTRLLPRENDGYLSPDDPAVCAQFFSSVKPCLTQHRSRPTTSGASEPYGASPRPSSPSASSGGHSS
jgi:hypothetical protein